MKLRIMLIMIVVVMLVAGSLAAADEPTSYIFGGAEYDKTEGFGTTVGYAHKVFGKVWIMPRGIMADEAGAADLSTAYIIAHRNLRFGLVAAPGVNWVGTEDLTAYLTGAAGGLLGYIDGKSHLGLFLSGTYKAGSDGYEDGWQLGAWLTKGL